MAFDDVAEAMVANYLELTGRIDALDALLASIPGDSRVPAIRVNANLPTIQSLLSRITTDTQSTQSSFPGTELGLSPQSGDSTTRHGEAIKLVVWANPDCEADIISVDCSSMPTVKLCSFELFMDFYRLTTLETGSRMRYWHRYSYEDQRWVLTTINQAFTVPLRTTRILLKQADIERGRAWGIDLELAVPDVPGVKRARPPGSSTDENGLSKRFAAVNTFGTPSPIGPYPTGTASAGGVMGAQALVSSYLGSTQTASPFANSAPPLMTTPGHHASSPHTPVVTTNGGEPLLSGQGKGHGRWPQRHTFASVLPILRSIVEDEQCQPRNSKIRQSRLEAANVDALKNKSNAAQAILLLRSFGVLRAEEWGMQSDNGSKSWSEFRKYAVENGGREKEGQS